MVTPVGYVWFTEVLYFSESVYLFLKPLPGVLELPLMSQLSFLLLPLLLSLLQLPLPCLLLPRSCQLLLLRPVLDHGTDETLILEG